MAKRKLKVFLSHAPADEAAVRQLYDQLNAEGWIDVWLAEENVLVGHDHNLEIEKAVNESELAIVCISKSSTSQQGSVQKELRLVLEMAQNMPEGVIYIVPLKLEECEPPFLLRSLRFGNYFEGEREKGYQRLLASLRARAKGLGISLTKSASDRPKTSLETGERVAQQFDNSTHNVNINGNAQGNIVIMGDHNVIYPHDQSGSDDSDPRTEKPAGE